MNKNKLHTSLSDEHLEDILKTSAKNMVPEYEKSQVNIKNLWFSHYYIFN
jgi:hypothetical protein